MAPVICGIWSLRVASALDVDSILLEYEEEMRLVQHSNAAPAVIERTQRPVPPSIPAWRRALDPLFEQLEEVLAEGHKTLVY